MSAPLINFASFSSGRARIFLTLILALKLIPDQRDSRSCPFYKDSAPDLFASTALALSPVTMNGEEKAAFIRKCRNLLNTAKHLAAAPTNDHVAKGIPPTDKLFYADSGLILKRTAFSRENDGHRTRRQAIRIGKVLPSAYPWFRDEAWYRAFGGTPHEKDLDRLYTHFVFSEIVGLLDDRDHASSLSMFAAIHGADCVGLYLTILSGGFGKRSTATGLVSIPFAFHRLGIGSALAEMALADVIQETNVRQFWIHFPYVRDPDPSKMIHFQFFSKRGIPFVKYGDDQWVAHLRRSS